MKFKFKSHHLLLVILLLVSLFLHLYRLEPLMNFHSDEGRDLLIMKKMFDTHKPALLGPRTSTGNMFLGPLYYYLVAPALYLAHFNPLGPVIFLGLIGVFNTWLIYFLGTKLKDNRFGLLTATLFTFSPLALLTYRNSWNPNLMPLISTLLFLVYLKFKTSFRQGTNLRLPLFLVGILFGIDLQLHYFSLLLIVVFSFYLWLITKSKVRLLFNLPYLLLGLFLTTLPFLVFELRHQFINTKAIFQFLQPQPHQGNFSFPPSPQLYFHRLTKVWLNFWAASFGRLALQINDQISLLFAKLFTLLNLIWLGILFRRRRLHLSSFIIYLTFFLAAFYRGNIYFHYLLFLLPFNYFLVANWFTDHNLPKLFRFTSILLISLTFLWSLPRTYQYLTASSNHQVEKSREIIDFIAKDAGSTPYNIVTAHDNTRGTTYQYFASLLPNPPSNHLQTTVYLICEDRPCNQKDIESPWLFRRGPAHPGLEPYLGHPFLTEFTQPRHLVWNRHIVWGVWVAKLHLDL